MGYYTNFHLEVSSKTGGDVDPDTLQEVRDNFDEMFGYNGAFDEVTDWSAEWKWYDWEIDMKKFSAAFPDLRFELEGLGEERENWWTAWFHDGNVHKSCAKITPPDIAPPEGFWED